MRTSSQTTKNFTRKANINKSKATFQVAFGDVFFVFLGVLLIGVLWQVSALRVQSGMSTGAGALILPEPMAVLSRFARMAWGDPVEAQVFWSAFMGSLGRGLLGFSVALLTASVFGIAAGLWRPLQQLIYPAVQLLRSVPVMSIILYLLLFVATDWVAVWVSFLIVFPLIYTNTMAGVASVDQKLLEMATLYSINTWQRLRHIYFPALFPYWIAACLTGMGLNIKAVITAEAMSLPSNSFGAMMSEARNYLDTEGLLAITLWIIVLAVLLDAVLLVIKWLLMKGRRWYVVHRRSS